MAQKLRSNSFYFAARRLEMFKWNFFLRYLYNLIEMVSVYRIPNAGRF